MTIKAAETSTGVLIEITFDSREQWESGDTTWRDADAPARYLLSDVANKMMR